MILREKATYLGPKKVVRPHRLGSTRAECCPPCHSGPATELGSWPRQPVEDDKNPKWPCKHWITRYSCGSLKWLVPFWTSGNHRKSWFQQISLSHDPGWRPWARCLQATHGPGSKKSCLFQPSHVSNHFDVAFSSRPAPAAGCPKPFSPQSEIEVFAAVTSWTSMSPTKLAVNTWDAGDLAAPWPVKKTWNDFFSMIQKCRSHWIIVILDLKWS